MIGIYKIANPKNKIYIGQSVDILYRTRCYKTGKNCKTQTKLKHSIEKYGWDNHSLEVIEECPEHLLNERERYWQDFYNSLYGGLNCRLTKTSDKSGALSIETKDKIRKSLIGHSVSEMTKRKIGKKNKGRKYGQEVRDKVSKNNGRWNAKLSYEDVDKICKMYMAGKTSQQVREIFPNVHACTLAEIRIKKIYRKVTTLYNLSKPSKKGNTRRSERKVLCIEDKKTFDGLLNTANHYGVDFRYISQSALKNVKIKSINKTFKYV
jgi:group I intron endonuclease